MILVSSIMSRKFIDSPEVSDSMNIHLQTLESDESNKQLAHTK